MWWKRFLGSPIGIRALPREKLEHLILVANEQMQKMKNQERALASEIHDLQVETTRQLGLRQQSTMDVMDPNSDEVCPPRYSASERRCIQLRGKIAQMMADMEKVDTEIAGHEEVLSQYLELHQAESPVPRDSLLVGPFNNSDLRKIYTELSLLAGTTQNKNERDDFIFCLDILSGESKLLGRRIEEMRQQFNQDCVAEQENLDGLIAEGVRLQGCVRKLHDQMELLWKKAEQLRPIAPSIRKDLQNGIKQLSTTTEELGSVTQEVETLRQRRDEYREKLSTLSAELLERPLDDAGRQSEIDESVSLRQQRTRLEIELHELEQTELRNQSTIRSGLEAIEECEVETADIWAQCEKIRDATEGQRWKIEAMQDAHVSVNDVHMIARIAEKYLPDEIIKSIAETKEHISLLKKRNTTMKRRVSQLVEQEGDYQEQIVALQELLATGSSGLADEDSGV
jgi:chromosome segregation ATPase